MGQIPHHHSCHNRGHFRGAHSLAESSRLPARPRPAIMLARQAAQGTAVDLSSAPGWTASITTVLSSSTAEAKGRWVTQALVINIKDTDMLAKETHELGGKEERATIGAPSSRRRPSSRSRRRCGWCWTGTLTEFEEIIYGMVGSVFASACSARSARVVAGFHAATRVRSQMLASGADS